MSHTETKEHANQERCTTTDIDYIASLATIPGVARDSIRNRGTREINCGIKKKIIIC
jgi:hypothetical protein